MSENNIGHTLFIKVVFNDKCLRKDSNIFLKFDGLEKPGVKCNLNACNDNTTFKHRGTENDYQCQQVF